MHTYSGVKPFTRRKVEKVVQPREGKVFGRPPSTFQYQKGLQEQDFEQGTTKGNGFKLRECGFQLDVEKKFFTGRVLRHWNKLPREAVDVPSLEIFKAKVDGALSNLVW